jgi:hypothetical protein
MLEINIDRNNSFTSSFRSMRILYQKNDIKLFNKGELILNKNSTELMNNKILNFLFWKFISFTKFKWLALKYYDTSLSIALAFNSIILGLNIKKENWEKIAEKYILHIILFFVLFKIKIYSFSRV